MKMVDDRQQTVDLDQVYTFGEVEVEYHLLQ